MPERYISDARIHDGHRQRMRRKFKEHGSDVFDTYELLEMLLYFSIPLGDTNPTAKRLLCAYQGLDGVLSATREELMNVEGVGPRSADLLLNVGRLPDILACSPLIKETAFSDYERTASFFVERLKNEQEHAVLMLLLDNDMIPIALEKLYAKDFDSAAVKVDKFMSSAINANASVAIVAHNHPFGPNFPSRGDIEMNKNLENALCDIGVLLAEHYIICGDRYIGLVHRKFECLRGAAMVDEFVNGRERLNEKTDDLWTNDKISFFTPSDIELSQVAAMLKPAAADTAEKYAYELLSLYGSFGRVLSVDHQRLARVTDERAAHYIKLIARITSRRVTEKMVFGHMYTAREITAYFKGLFLGEACEKIYVMSVSGDRRILGCESISTGTVNNAGITPRAVLAAAIKNKAKSVILAHNHPSGIPEPSVDDKTLTVSLAHVLESSAVKLRAHYVVAGNLCEPVIENMNF